MNNRARKTLCKRTVKDMSQLLTACAWKSFQLHIVHLCSVLIPNFIVECKISQLMYVRNIFDVSEFIYDRHHFIHCRMFKCIHCESPCLHTMKNFVGHKAHSYVNVPVTHSANEFLVFGVLRTDAIVVFISLI